MKKQTQRNYVITTFISAELMCQSRTVSSVVTLLIVLSPYSSMSQKMYHPNFTSEHLRLKMLTVTLLVRGRTGIRTEVLCPQHVKPLPGHLSYCERHRSQKQDVLTSGDSSCNTILPLFIYFMRMAELLEFKATWGYLPSVWIQKIHCGQIKDKHEALDLAVLLNIPMSSWKEEVTRNSGSWTRAFL